MNIVKTLKLMLKCNFLIIRIDLIQSIKSGIKDTLKLPLYYSVLYVLLHAW